MSAPSADMALAYLISHRLPAQRLRDRSTLTPPTEVETQRLIAKQYNKRKRHMAAQRAAREVNKRRMEELRKLAADKRNPEAAAKAAEALAVAEAKLASKKAKGRAGVDRQPGNVVEFKKLPRSQKRIVLQRKEFNRLLHEVEKAERYKDRAQDRIDRAVKKEREHRKEAVKHEREKSKAKVRKVKHQDKKAKAAPAAVDADADTDVDADVEVGNIEPQDSFEFQIDAQPESEPEPEPELELKSKAKPKPAAAGRAKKAASPAVGRAKKAAAAAPVAGRSKPISLAAATKKRKAVHVASA